MSLTRVDPLPRTFLSKRKAFAAFSSPFQACLVAAIVISIAFLVVYHIYAFSGWTLIGDSDRLNAFLNIRKFEIDYLREFGRVPTWNDRIFMGNGTAGLHYMLPGIGISPYLESLLPVQDLFRTMTFVSLFLAVLAGVAAFAFFREICRNDFASLVGGFAYCTSVYAVHRLAQLDSSFVVLVVMPLGMLLIRRISLTHLCVPFVGLALLTSFLVFFTFLQEAAYALVLFGLYAIHRSIVTRSIAPVAVLVLAAGAAVSAASPRVLTVLEDFRELDRTNDFQQTSWIEVYRFFAEGFFGRTQGEGRSIENGTNLHEGLQLLGSSVAALLIVAAAASGRSRGERVTGFVLLVVLSMVVAGPLYRVYTFIQSRGGFPSTESAVLVTNCLIGLAIAAFLATRHRKAGAAAGAPTLFPTRPSESGHDLVFFLVVLSAVLCVVLVTEARWVFYLMFLKVDFTHARFSIAGLIPCFGIVAILLSRMMSEIEERSIKVGALGAVVVTCAASVWFIEGSLLAGLVDYVGIKPMRIAWNRAVPLVAVRLAFWMLLFAIAYRNVARRVAFRPELRGYFAIALGLVIAIESAVYAQFKLTGPHTLAHQTPFEQNNYMNAAPGDLRPPTAETQSSLRRELQAEEFRSIFIAPPAKFPAFVAPHLANFWGLRVVDGYSAGVPWRLASFDWPGDVRTLRSIAFGSASKVPWELLSYLNVRYGIQVSNELYFNRTAQCTESKKACIPSFRLQENPFEPTPRHFFAGRVEPGGMPFARDRNSTELLPPRAVVATATGARGVLVSWNAPWSSDFGFVVESAVDSPEQARSLAKSTFRRSGQIGPAGRTFAATSLTPGRRYLFRVKSCRDISCSDFSDIAAVTVPHPGIAPPTDLRVTREGTDSIRLTWRSNNPDFYHVIERQRGPNARFKEQARTLPGKADVVLPYEVADAADAIRIQACSTLGCSPHSEPTSITEWVNTPQLDRRLRPALDLQDTSYVEGLSASKVLSTGGHLSVHYQGDTIVAQMDPAESERFLVINEMFHPRWKAFAGEQELKVVPTNTVMRGVFVPVGVSRITLRFVPFLYTRVALAIMVAGALLLVLLSVGMLRIERSGQDQPPKPRPFRG